MEYSRHVCSPRIPHGCIYLRRVKTWKGGGRCALYLCTVNRFGICDDEWLLGEELYCKWPMLQRQMDFQRLPGRIWLTYLSRGVFHVLIHVRAAKMIFHFSLLVYAKKGGSCYSEMEYLSDYVWETITSSSASGLLSPFTMSHELSFCKV